MKKLEGTKFHFIGIGGIGMCGLAELLNNLGASVTGSDLGENKNTQHLEKIGIKVFFGHAAKNIGQPDVVVYSSAVKKDNVEYVEARERKIPVIPRAEALAEIMNLKRGIAVAGTHGKTTTTSMAAAVFISAKQDPTIVVGGRLDLIKSTAKLGLGEWLIAEADESDGSFQKLSPEIAIITNIDDDHMDHYKNFENLENAFYEFALRVPFYGTVIVCGDDPKTRELFADFPKKILFYGFAKTNHYILSGEKGRYKVQFKNGDQLQNFCEFSLSVSGKHNALNSLAAVLAGYESGLSIEDCARGVETFSGVDRRFQFKGEKAGVKIYDDYGHHPTEILAVLDAFKEKFPQQKLHVAFQPHRYSRFESCWDKFLACFKNADQLYILPVYAAGEKPIESIDSVQFASKIKHPSSRYVSDFQMLTKIINTEAKAGDVFLTLGAGDIWKVGEALCRN